MWEGVGDRVSRESIWDIVQNALDPLSGEVVGHDPAFETLEVWVLDSQLLLSIGMREW